MKKEDVKIGMEVVLTDRYSYLEKGEVFKILKPQSESCFIVDHDGDKSFLAPFCVDFEPTDPNFIPSEIKTLKDGTDQWHWIEHMLNEVDRAESKHPNWPDDKIYALAIVGEEFGEAMREAVKIEMNESDKSLPNLKKELIHTMATCFRALKHL